MLESDPFIQRKDTETEEDYRNRMKSYFSSIIENITGINPTALENNQVKTNLEEVLKSFLDNLNRFNSR